MTDHVDNLMIGAIIAIVIGVAIFLGYAALQLLIQAPKTVAVSVVGISVFALISYVLGYIHNEVDITVDDITSNIMNSIRSLF